MLNFTKEEKALIKSLNTPAKIQDFLNNIPINHERDGIDRIKSPINVLRDNNAHCIEAAILGAYILSVHGYKPLLIHLETTKEDFEHVVAPFKMGGLWGALSKTNHSVLRFRDPIYKNIRELVMSYFHEYAMDNGQKTLRKYSKPLDLKQFEKGWEISGEDLWGIDEELGKIEHYSLIPKGFKLRPTDIIEREVGKILEWKK